MVQIYDATFAVGPRRPDVYSAAAADPTPTDYFPHWPVVRGAGRYQMDPAESERELSQVDLDLCTKYRHGHPVLTPGVMLYLCQHKVCYGFSVMDRPESPRTVFDTLMRRWPAAPTRLIYDNCCRLHIFCLNREPAFFQKTQFFVDRSVIHDLLTSLTVQQGD